MKKFIELLESHQLDEDYELHDQNSYWLRGDSVENENNIEVSKISIYHPLYLTANVRYALHYAESHSEKTMNSKQVIRLFKLKLSKNNYKTKILSLVDKGDIAKIGFPEKMAEFFKNADVYFSFSNASAWNEDRKHRPPEFTQAAVEVFKQNGLYRPNYAERNAYDKLDKPEKDKFKDDIKNTTGLKYSTTTLFNVLSKHSTKIETDSSFSDGVNAYLECFKLIWKNFPEKFSTVNKDLKANNTPKYIDALCLCLFKQILEKGYSAYFCPEKNRLEDSDDSVIVTEKPGYLCMALFDKDLIEEGPIEYSAKDFAFIAKNLLDSKLAKFSKYKKHENENSVCCIQTIVNAIEEYKQIENTYRKYLTIDDNGTLSNYFRRVFSEDDIKLYFLDCPKYNRYISVNSMVQLQHLIIAKNYDEALLIAKRKNLSEVPSTIRFSDEFASEIKLVDISPKITLF